MENAMPSASEVGREFVRQYYQLLNKEPLELHRFYSHNSQFLHGGKCDEQPTIGQTQIFSKIKDLQFKNPKVTIRQVDSQQTINSSVCVQVIGDLQNGGMQSRRFMQTFVLVPQTHKKFYVHNDIFRYQDEVFSDSEMENVVNAAAAQQHMETEQQVPQLYEGNNVVYHPMPTQAQVTPFDMSVPSVKPPQQAASRDDWRANGGGREKEHVVNGAPAPVPNSAELITQPEPEKEEPEPVTNGFDEQQLTEAEKKNLSWADRMKFSNHKKNAGSANNQPPAEAKIPQPPANTNASRPAAAPAQPQQSASNTNIKQEPQAVSNNVAGKNEQAGGGRGPAAGAGGQQNMKNNRAAEVGGYQVFVGNLPTDSSEDELRTFFSQCGDIMNVKIFPGDTAKPGYAFVTFSDPISPQMATDSDRCFRPGIRINVEAKREDRRGRGGGFRGGYRGGGGGGYYRGGNRR